MLKFFKKRPEAVAVPASHHGYLLPQTGTSLLSTPKRKKLLENIWQRTSLSRRQFEQLYIAPITRYAEIVQLLPASENHHHAYPGGMLDHGLEIVAYALKMRQSMMLPLGATPETQAEQSEAWSAAVSYAALLHDVGKVAVDVHVEIKGGRKWFPWNGLIDGPYRVRYRKGRDYKLHNAAAGLMYSGILGSEAMSWLSQYDELWASLIFVLAGQYEHAGVLGELVVRADKASVAQELGGNPNRAVSAPKQSLQRKLVEGLRYLLKQELKINQPEASDGWLTVDGLWLVSKTVSDRLRAYLLSQGVEGIPDKNSAVFNILQDNSIVQVNSEGKAIWKATVLSQTGWKNTFTFLRVAPALIWEGSDRPEEFLGTVTVENECEEGSQHLADSATDVIENRLQTPLASELGNEKLVSAPTAPVAPAPAPKHDVEDDHVADLLSLFEMVDTKPQVPSVREPRPPSPPPLPADSVPQQVMPASDAATSKRGHGQHFLNWVRMGVLTHKVVINDAKAKVHTVDGTVFLVTPEIFRRYAQEHPEIATEAKEQGFDEEWRWVQRCFEKLGVHRKRSNGLNIWTCDIRGPRKSKNLKGYLLLDPKLVFNEVPYDNPSVVLTQVEVTV